MLLLELSGEFALIGVVSIVTRFHEDVYASMYKFCISGQVKHVKRIRSVENNKADNVYVYNVRAWERHSWSGKSIQDYWDSGITLTEWLADGTYDAREWEVLLKPEDIIGEPRRVSRKRLVSAAGSSSEDMDYMLKREGVK